MVNAKPEEMHFQIAVYKNVGKIENFLTFADFFFDGFLKDIMIQSKIRKTQDQIDTAVHRVENMPDCLERGSLK